MMKEVTGWLMIGIAAFVAGCNESGKDSGNKQVKDSTIHISVDESFRPVIHEEVKVFEAAYPDTRVLVQYKPEAECLRDLQQDSTKLVIISRELNRQETKYYADKLGYTPEFGQLADDAIAVIVNEKCADSVFSMEDVKALLSGTSAKKLSVALDGKTATSTVRYLKDSVLNGQAFGKNVTGANNSEDLINYVSANEDAVGFVGVSWVTNAASEQQEQALKHVRLALIECRNNCEKGSFARPSQQTITFGQYPLVRGLYYVVKENYAGLGSRLVFFLSTERGQLIFRRASLVPTKMNFSRRKTMIKQAEQ